MTGYDGGRGGELPDRPEEVEDAWLAAAQERELPSPSTPAPPEGIRYHPLMSRPDEFVRTSVVRLHDS